MKRKMLLAATGACVMSYASDYVVIVSKEMNEYVSYDYNELVELSEWEDSGSPYDCGTPFPSTESYFEGVSFDQEASCSQKQKKYEETYHESKETGEKTLMSREEHSSQVVQKTTDVGTAVGVYKAKSCLDILNHGGAATDAYYNITPKSTEINVFCNMSDGGYTQYEMDGSYQYSRDIEAKCEENDLQLFVPRTKSHLQKAVKRHSNYYLYLMGIYPNYVGARCDTVYFNSADCHNWSPKDNGKFFVYQRPISFPHGDGGVGVYPEPNGDNSLGGSMAYNYNSDGLMISLNDISDTNPVTIGGYTTNKWLCSAKDEKDI